MRNKPPAVIDVEATGLIKKGVIPDIICVSVTTQEFSKCLVWSEQTRLFLNEVCTQYTPVFHNAPYDITVLINHGVDIHEEFDDTMLMAWVLNPSQNSYSLKNLSATTGFYKSSFEGEFTEYSPELAAYNIQDGIATLALYYTLLQEFEADQRAYKLYTDVEIPFVWCVIEFQTTGVYVDKYRLTRLIAIKERQALRLEGYITRMFPEYPGKVVVLKRQPANLQLKTCRREFLGYGKPREYLAGIDYQLKNKEDDDTEGYIYQEMLPFNPGSSDQVAWALMQQGWQPKAFTATGKPATGKELLEDIDLPLARLVTLSRNTSHDLSTYLKPYLEQLAPNSILYGSFQQAQAPTGRVAASEPNLMAMKGSVKKIVTTPNPDKILCFDGDMSQIEPRILAYYLHRYMGDDELLNAFLAGIDYHTHNATTWDVSRRVAKTLALAISYGTGVHKTASKLKVSVAEAKKFLKVVKDKTQTTDQLKERVLYHTRKNNGVIHTLLGRRLVYPDIMLDKTEQNMAKIKYAERQVFNGIFQGGCADVLKAITNQALPIARKYGARFSVPVHDELFGYVPASNAEAFCQEMTELFSSSQLIHPVPIKASFRAGLNWYDLHD